MRRFAAIDAWLLMFALTATVGASDEFNSRKLQIPEVAGGTPRRITSKDLVLLRDIDNFTLSPDGRYVAFPLRQAVLETNSYRTAWFVAPTTRSGPPVNVGDGGDPQLLTYANGSTSGEFSQSPAQWSPDAQWIAYLVQKDSSSQLWRSRHDGTEREQLTHNAANVRGFAWESHGTKIYLIVEAQTREELRDADKREAEQGYLLDGRFFPAARQDKPIYRQTHPMSIGTKLGRKVEWSSEVQLWVYDVESHVERKADPAENDDYWRLIKGDDLHYKRVADSLQLTNPALVAFSPMQQFVAWLDVARADDRAALPDLRVYAATARSDATPIECKAAACAGRIQALWWSEGSQEVVFDRGEGINRLSHGLYAWSIASNRVRQVLRTDDLLFQCSMHTDRLYCLHESTTTPREIVAIRVTDGSMENVADPNPEFHNIELGQVERLEWKNEFGHWAFGHLLKPLDYDPHKKYPLAIVTYRSVGFIRGGVDDEYPAQVMAANGIAVLSFDEPEVSEYLSIGQDFNDINRAVYQDLFQFRSTQSSLDKGVELIEKSGLIDDTRLAVTGLGSGAAIAYYALLYSDHRYAAAITSSPPPDPLTFYVQPISSMTDLAIPGLRFPDGPKGFLWKRLSTALNVTRIQTPVLINIADRELVMTMQTVSAMTEYHRPIEVYVYPDEWHVKRWPVHRYAIYQRNLDWLNFWLNDREDPDPAKAEQYARWRELRKLQEANGKKAPELRRRSRSH
jgi:dipeptidyl aminopeptidase/acylaminoacyl peptidase